MGVVKSGESRELCAPVGQARDAWVVVVGVEGEGEGSPAELFYKARPTFAARAPRAARPARANATSRSKARSALGKV